MRVKMAQRTLWLKVMALGLFGLLGYQLYRLQLTPMYKGVDLSRIAYEQRIQSLPLQLRRGRILDRNGVELTGTEWSTTVGLFPKLMSGLDRMALERVFTPMQAHLILEGAQTGPDPAWVIEGLSQQDAEAVRAANLPGLVTGPTASRYGPNSLARHLVGYANSQGGQQGLERAFDKELAGDRVPHLVATFDGRDRLLYGGIRETQATAGKEPYDLYTTIDAQIQRLVEREMDRTPQPGKGPLRAAVVVLDARSGEPLALASRPHFDQGAQPPAGQESIRWDRALLAYEPGSVFKPLVAAAALDEGKVRLDEEVDCPASYELGGIRFGNANGKAYGRITFREAIAVSCNTAMIQVGYERLGAERLLEAARRFGLGRATGIYPGAAEAAGHIPSLTYGGDVAQFSFGQGGLMASPLQIARAYAAIANGGVLPPVRLVTAIRTPAGEVLSRPQAAEPERIMRRETAADLQDALRAVTDPHGAGTGRAAWVEKGGSAGKTGSAETVQNGVKITHAWFAGWVPARAPRYVVVVLIENGQSGGGFAAPLFRRIGEGLAGW